MKRILSLILTLSMLFSMTVYVQAADEGTHELDLWGYERFEQILSDIGVEMPQLELSSPLKRGDFVNGLVAFFGISSIKSAAGSYNEYIKAAYSEGWITEAEKNDFKADETILLKDAARYIINALGYNKKPEYQTNAEKSYYSDATDLDLLLGITTGWENPISYAQMLKIFYNTMGASILEYKGQGRYEMGFAMLYEIHEIRVIEGVVTANYQSGIAGVSCGDNSVEIDGVKYECLANTDGLVGKYAISFVRDGAVLHILESARKNTILTIANEDVENFTDLRKLTYLDQKDKKKEIKFEYPPTVLVNGSKKTINSTSDIPEIIGENGEVEAIDNDGDGLYEVLRVTNYITYVVSRINYSKGIITDSYTNKVLTLDLNNLNITVIRDGEAATFDDIKAKDVIEISADAEKVEENGERTIDMAKCKYITIVATSGSVGGVVNRTTGTDKIEIDGTEYELSDYFQKAVKDKLVKMSPGLAGAFYENHAGKIVYVNTAANAFDKYGFVVWGDYDVQYDGVLMKIFTSDQKVETFELADKVIVDGASKQNNNSFEDIQELFVNVGGERKVRNQLVIYRLNSAGKINYIDTALKTSDDEDPETALRLDVEFYGNPSEAVVAADDVAMYTTGTRKYNTPGDVFTYYYAPTTETSNDRYTDINLKPVSESVFVVSGFMGDPTLKGEEYNDSAALAHNNMQIDQPLASAKNFEVTTVASKFGVIGDYQFNDYRCIKFYNVGDDNSVQYMVYYDPSLSPSSMQSVTSSSAIGFYVGRGKAVNKDGESTDFIRVHLPGQTEETRLVCKDATVLANITPSKVDDDGKWSGLETTKTADDYVSDYVTADDLVEGDIIRYSVNIDGEVDAVKRDVDFTKMKTELTDEDLADPACFENFKATGIESPGDYDAVIRRLGTNGDSFFTLVAPYSRWKVDTTDVSDAAMKPKYRSAYTKTSNVLIYDVVEGTFSKGTLDDLFTAKECGTGASVLYVRHTVSKSNLILAYNFMPKN